MREERELKSLEIVKKIIRQQLGGVYITESDPIDKYDLIVNWNGKKIYLEVKERMGKYTQLYYFSSYSLEGWQMEKIKYDFLVMKLSRYVNIFRINGEIITIFWNVNKINSNTSNNKILRAPGTTTDSVIYQNPNYVNKESILLKPEEGIIFMYNYETDKFDIINYDELIEKLKKKTLKEL
jgi:hypothetical protein